MSIFFYIISLFSVLATFLPMIRKEVWWIRVFDFPRLQILVFLIISLAVNILYSYSSILDALLGICIIIQCIIILPYTALYKKQVLKSSNDLPEHHLSIVVSNVLMYNKEAQKCIDMILKADPDMVLTVETDKWWEVSLKPVFEKYPFTYSAPHGNTYGMIFFSKLKIEHAEIKYLLEHDIPSLHAVVKLKNRRSFKFFGLHPKPPAPQEAKSTIKRDAELIIVGKEVRQSNQPAIVAGDLNDVAWSHTTHLFQKISGLLDPRIGRGLYSTFNSKYPLVRWPLDHIFHSPHFKLVDLKLLPPIGSDHFPIYIKLSYEPEQMEEIDLPEASAEDLQTASEKIKEAKRTFNA